MGSAGGIVVECLPTDAKGPGFDSFLSSHLYSFNLVLSLDVYLQDSFPVQLAMCLASYTAVLGSNLGAAAEFENCKKD